MKYKIFIAAPLFNEMEIYRNKRVKEFLVDNGYEVFLAQDDPGLVYEKFNSEEDKITTRKRIFKYDIDELIKSDIVILLLDGRTPDEGACVEYGIAWALKKKCLIYKTDFRAMDCFGDNNIMIDGCVDFLKAASSLEELLSLIKNLEN